MTARECAKDLISVYVLRGDSIKSLNTLGCACEDYRAEVKHNKVVVDRIGEEELIPISFPLEDLYNEIKSGVGQAQLF